MRFLYSALLTFLSPLLLARSARKYRGLNWGAAQRLGANRPNLNSPVWIHAASVGETRAVASIANQLAQHYPVLITTTTPTGADQVRQLCPDVTHAFIPYDLPWIMMDWMSHLTPRALVLVETELWPNLIRAANQNDTPVVLVNGRLSPRSARGYRRLGVLAATMMQSIDLCLVQTEAHADEFKQFGADPVVVGNIKFDTALAASDLPPGDWVVAASTHPDEEVACLSAFTDLSSTYPNLRLLIVPRHPQRFDEVAQLISPCGRASLNQWDQPVVLGDAMGRLGGWLNGAKVAFVGGTLAPRGSQSPIEAALGGASIIAGPSRYNFVEAYELLAQGELIDLASPQDIRGALEAAMDADGQKNQQIIRAHQGATQRTLDALHAVLKSRN